MLLSSVVSSKGSVDVDDDCCFCLHCATQTHKHIHIDLPCKSTGKERRTFWFCGSGCCFCCDHCCCFLCRCCLCRKPALCCCKESAPRLSLCVCALCVYSNSTVIFDAVANAALTQRYARHLQRSGRRLSHSLGARRANCNEKRTANARRAAD